MAIVHLPRPLREKLGEEAGEALVTLLDQLFERERLVSLDELEARFVRHLSEIMGGFRAELQAKQHEGYTALRSEMREGDAALAQKVEDLRQAMREGHAELTQKIEDLRQEMREGDATLAQNLQDVRQDIDNLRVEMYAQRADLIRWMFAFWAGQFVLLGGLMVALR